MNLKTFAMLAVAAAILALPAAAFAQSSVSVSRYVTGFTADSDRVGPVGVAFDSNDRLFVTATDGWLYRFDGPGGVASPSTRIGSHTLSSDPGGLAFDDAGNLYAARFGEGDVVEVNPATGEIIRALGKIQCAVGIAYDPVSGSLFVTSGCTDKLFRIADPRASSPHVSIYASGINRADGVATGPDGTIYVVEGSGDVNEIKGTASSDPGHVRLIARVLRGDGISVGKGFLILNRTNGIITRLDLTGATPPQDLFNGGSRGDFSTVGSDGCLYATQSDHILRVTDLDGSCTDLGGKGGLATTTPEAGGNDLPAARGCLDRRRFTFHLHHGPGSTVVRVNVFVNGVRRVHKRGSDIKTVTLKRLPKKKFRVRVVSVHSNGSMLISRRTYKGCKKSRPHTRRHSHR